MERGSRIKRNRDFTKTRSSNYNYEWICSSELSLLRTSSPATAPPAFLEGDPPQVRSPGRVRELSVTSRSVP